MNRYKKLVNVFVFLLLIMTTIKIDYNPFIIEDMETLSYSIAKVAKSDNTLKMEIERKGSEYEEVSQNAYIDKVWKKTPGRNGLSVNIEESYKRMKKGGVFNKSLLVFDQPSPEISLEDLPPSPIYRGHPEKEMVSFLINVSWGNEHIPKILNILNDHDVKASFFIEGKWAKENVNLVKMIDEQEHVIGNHAYNHPDMARLSKQEMTDQIEETNNIIKAITGKRPKWFAPPSGSYTNLVVEVAHHLGMEMNLWTVDTIDWKNPSVSVMMNRVVTNIHPGAMILMHPTPSVAGGLDQMIVEIKKLGYKIDTIDKLMSEDR